MITGSILLLTFISCAAIPSPSLVRELVKVSDEIPRQESVVYACDETNSNNSFIYCSGRILEAVNILSLFNDSKTFVDMPMVKTPNETLDEFNRRFGNKNASEIDRNELIAFINEYFSEKGTELDVCEPSDWIPNPPKLMRIVDETARKFALDLNAIWKTLCRKMKPTAGGLKNSLIYVPNEFIVPGGRFIEFYYWDTYWILKGLIASEMLNTAKSIIGNFLHVVETVGFIPNGGRVYYLQRSHPPLLIPMVYEYITATQDVDFLRSIMPTLVKEFQFWQNNRLVNVTGLDNNNYPVYLYRTNCNTPRPESYREDVTLALEVPSEERPQLYQDLGSAAESGWDFSTRWFEDKKTLKTIETTNFMPVDLNAFMCYNMGLMEYFYKKLGNTTEARRYNAMRQDHIYALHFVFYNETKGGWFDFNVKTRAHNTDFYAPVAAPLFGNCYQPVNLAKPHRLFDYMNESGAFSYPGGVPVTITSAVGQQWDFPNGWSPLVHMIIEGLRKSDAPEVQEQAFYIAQKWVKRNYEVFNATGFMWEKYDVTGHLPSAGAGGEYDVQPGFGWSNGAALDLLVSYYDRINLSPQSAATSPPDSSYRNNFSTAMIALCSVLTYALM